MKLRPSLIFQSLREFGLILGLMLPSPSLFAAVSISLSGTAENTSNALEKYRTNAVSANISLGLGQHILLGVTHRRSFEHKDGYKRTEGTQPDTYVYLPFKDFGTSITNSLDLTIIPYNGLISPFIFGGVASRQYENEILFLENKIRSSQTLFPIPNYGFGTIIQLGRGFQLKITQTYTPGVQTILDDDGQETNRMVKDSYSQIWIGYKI